MEKTFYYVVISDTTLKDEIKLSLSREDFEEINVFRFIDLGFKVTINKLFM